MTPARLHCVLAQRDAGRQNADAVLTELGPAKAHVTTEGSKAMRVTVRVAFANGRRMNSEVVIFLRDSGTEPYSVLFWRGHLDEATQ